MTSFEDLMQQATSAQQRGRDAILEMKETYLRLMEYADRAIVLLDCGGEGKPFGAKRGNGQAQLGASEMPAGIKPKQEL